MAAEPKGADERLAAWRVLATVFAAEPSAEVLEEIRAGGLEALLPDAAGDPEAARALEALRTAAAGDGARLDLAAAYAGLFLGAGGPRSAPPYASAYLGARGRLYDAPARAMARLLREADLDVADRGEAPDHLAVQLALLGALLERADAPARALHAELCDRWLLSWVPAFAGDVRRLDRTGFYAAAADLALWFLRRECATAPSVG